MKKESYSSLENALQLMNIFTVGQPEYKLNELAEKLKIAPSTTHRLLTTLSSEGFIAKDSLSNKYRLGISIRSLESVILNKMDLYHLSQNILEQTAFRTNLSTSLVVPFKDTSFYLNVIDVENLLFHKLSYRGKQCSFLSTSAGKVLLLGKKDVDISSFMPDQSYVSKFRSQLQSHGYIQYNHEHQLGVSTIAVPVKNQRNETIAALEIIGAEKQVQPHTETIKKAGYKLSALVQNSL